MTETALAVIDRGMESLGLNYAFMQWEDKPAYPYFTGDYQEEESMSEDGQQTTRFTLNGWARGTRQELEQAKEKIKRYFDSLTGKTVIAEDGSVVTIFYANSMPVPTGVDELKRIQINLLVKEWTVI